jgi:hypothetical protein
MPKKESVTRETNDSPPTKEQIQNFERVVKHQEVEFHERRYQYAGDCTCAGCQSLRRYPEPTLCEWCGKIHCGGVEHCDTEEHGTSNVIRGSSEATDDSPEGLLEGVCWLVRNHIKQLTKTIKENYDMAIPRYQGPTTKEDSAAPTRGSRGGGRQRQGTGHPALNLSDLTIEPKAAKILGVKVGPGTAQWNKDQTVVTCKLSLGGQLRMWYLTVNNPNLGILQDAFGNDENDWADKKIQLFIEESEWDGKQNIRVETDEPVKSAKKTKK